MSPENKITEIPAYWDKSSIDAHMEEMNKEGYELIHVQEIQKGGGLEKPPTYEYRMFWRKVEWKQ